MGKCKTTSACLSVFPCADTLEEFQEMNKSVWKKVQEKFAPTRPEEKHRAWTRGLSRPRT